MKRSYEFKHAKKNKVKKIIIIICIFIILLTLILFSLYYFFGGNYLNINIDKNNIEVMVSNNDYEKVNVTCKFLGKEVKNIKLIKNIDINKIGNQEEEYECNYSFFKKSIIVKYNIIDTIPPILEIDSEDNTSIYVGDEYKEPSIKVTDNYDGDITEKIEKNGEIDTSKAGIYEIEYKVSDQSGNETSKIIKVEVKNKPIVKSNNTVKSSGNLSCGNPGTIYLTFDDGPNGYYTPVILDVLKKYNVKATFFVTSAGPDNLIKREYDEGHAIGLHSSTHAYNIIYTSSEAFWNDMNIVSDRIERITGLKTNLLRFPGGVSNTVSRHYNTGIMTQLSKEVEEKGYGYFDWNISSGDAGGTTDPNQEYYNVINNLSKSRGNVILMHDIKYHTSQAIDSIVKYGLDNGYTFDVLNTSIICHQNINN